MLQPLLQKDRHSWILAVVAEKPKESENSTKKKDKTGQDRTRKTTQEEELEL